MTRALMIGAKEREAIKALIEKAAARPTPLENIRRAAEHLQKTGSRFNAMNEAATIDIPLGFAVTYTHEEQPGAVCRHMSISVDGKRGTGPNPAAVSMLMEEFGFKNKLGELYANVGELRDGRLVIDLIEPLDGNMESLRT